jgi:hypothetical protein
MIKKDNRPINYLFILQLWQEQDSVSHERDPLRIILKDPKSGKDYSFQSLDQLMTFLVDLS